jgi:hypothetical protein
LFNIQSTAGAFLVLLLLYLSFFFVLSMSSTGLRAQLPVRKQGSFATGSWSTRTLTIDTDTATVTISRRNHPEHVFYHSLEVKIVQMWPRFQPDQISDNYFSLKAKMTIRILGTEVLVPYFDTNDAAVTNTSSLSSTPAEYLALNPNTPPLPPHVAEFAFIGGDYRKESRPLRSKVVDDLYEAWVLRFTSIEAYEAAVRLLACLRNRDGTLKRVYGSHVEADLAEIKRAWAAEHGLRAAVTAQQVSRESMPARQRSTEY